MTAHSDFHPFKSEKARERYLAHYDLRASQWPVAAEGRLVETSDGQTYVRISGPTDAPPLVLLPGVNASSLMWLPNISDFSQSYRVYAVDNIYDFGRSVWKRPMLTASDLVNWLDELFAQLGLSENVSLMGVSYGGWIASQYALRYPGRLRKLVLLAPVFTVLPLRTAFILRAMLCMIPHRRFTKSFIYWLAADAVAKNGISRQWVDAMVNDGYLGLRSFKSKRLVVPTILTDEELRALSVATLYMVGENEKLNSAQDALQRLNRVAPHIATELVSNAGHDLTISGMAEVNTKVLEFLGKTPNRGWHRI
ncbi:alpha/beta fold hydrolase [Afipia sp. GAS231]|uniref:alpha/beta fold hydrolase n=1 Tax=Afipia sp. GAS231 TaxID=1882747 RepID=UPI00087BBA01|nr:alpha/beta hydrolase [Afipia sp. GAS231]SDO61329.1 Pimeloyl-ACP methyl ester carboxylesterase [Afipia sp. GAS231]